MPASYSYIDVATLDAVREHFAAGDVLAILSTDLDYVIWVNGPGAEFFGHDDIGTALGAPSGLGFAAKRQIAATSGFPDIGRGRPIMLRLAAGMTSRAVALIASAITLPDGEQAILLAVPTAQSNAGNRQEQAQRAIGGFSEPGQFTALIGEDGSVEAASAGFEALGISSAALAMLATEGLSGSDRIVRHAIQAENRALPAGLARLTDDPARYLLVVIDEDAEGSGSPQPSELPTESAAASETPDPVEETAVADAPAAQPSSATNDAPARLVELGEVDEAFEDGATVPPASNRPAVQDNKPPQHDEWYFSGDEKAAGDPPQADAADDIAPEVFADPPAPETAGDDGAADEHPRPAIDRAAAPVRFVWRTDADGRFSVISPEFAAAVGAAADVVGRGFGEVAAAFRLDPDGEIASLLERRDTWSGRSVLWPVAGTDLKVPVDLAALPAYSRDRRFEGFRGFGVARTADAIVDTDGIGLNLGDALAPAAERARTKGAREQSDLSDVTGTEAATLGPPADAGKPADPFKGEVPVLTIVPKPERRFSDKVIRLAEHRPTQTDKSLSPVERIAFREIGERLKNDSKPGAQGERSAPEPETPGQAEVPATADSAPRMVSTTAAESAPTGTVGDLVKPVSAEVQDREIDDLADEAPAADNFAESVEAEAPVLVDEGDDAATLEDLAALDGVESADVPVGAEASAVAPGEATAQAPTRPRRGASLLDFMERPSARHSSPSPDAAPTSYPPAVHVEDAIRPVMAEFDPYDDAETSAYAEAETAAHGAELGSSDTPTPEAAGDQADASPAISQSEDDDVSTAPNDAKTPPAVATSDVVLETVEVSEAALSDHGELLARVESQERPDENDFAADASSALAASDESLEAPQSSRPDTAILDKLPVPVLIHAGDTLHHANAEFLALSGYDDLDALAEAGGLGALFAASDDDHVDGSDRQMRLTRRDGTDVPVDALLRSVPWGSGKALMLVVKPQRGETRETPLPNQPAIADLQARIGEMRTIIDTATDGVVLIARDGTIRSISRPAEALFGFDSDEVAGKPFAALFAIESQRAARDYLNGLSEHGVASVLNDGREVIGREAEGRFIPLFMSIGRLPSDSGYCAVVRDITQWKRAEEELTQARAMAERASSQKSEFLARVSHEIRTPLNAIIGFSELMIDEKFGPVTNDRYRDYLRDINRSGNHVLDLVNDLLDISKIEAGQQEMSYEAVSLNDTLAETVAMMQPQANRERVIIRSSFASRLPEVVADLRSVRQIALNILSNAVRYTQAGGQVIVSTAYEASGDVAMRVRDTGIGMSQAEIEQALKPFKQINALKRGRHDGTGLGLPLTKAMVEANRAKFSILSTPGEGTLVEITFPSTRVLAD